MKKLLTLISLLLPASLAVSVYAETGYQKANSSSKKTTKSKTVVIKTDELCADVKGYRGTTPVEITVVNGKITEVKALPNNESPKFFQRLLNSDFFKSWNGLTLQQAVEKPVDAVTGATYSSNAIIENVRRGAADQLKKNGK